MDYGSINSVSTPKASAPIPTAPVPPHTHNGLDSPLLPIPTMYAGSVVSAAKGAVFPSGWKVASAGTGLYLITHNIGSTKYVATATANVFASRWISVYAKTSTTFNVAIANTAGTATNTDFEFILIY